MSAAPSLAALLDASIDRIDFESPAGRTYAITRDRVLCGFEAFVLCIEHGRKGHKPRARREEFATVDAMTRRLRVLMRRRERHGYAIVR